MHPFDLPTASAEEVRRPPEITRNHQINNRKWRRFMWGGRWRYTSAAWYSDTTGKVSLRVVCTWHWRLLVLSNTDSPVDTQWRTLIQGFDWLGKAELIGAVHPRGWSCQKGNGGKSRAAQKFYCSCETTVETSWDTRYPQETKESGNIFTRAALRDVTSITYSIGMFCFFSCW